MIVLVGTRAAFAAELVVSTTESGSWPASVASLQGDVRGEGRTVHVMVTDDARRRLGCGEYTLTLDDVSANAFAIGACDAATGTTVVQLMHRGALFDNDDIVPRPLAAGITATQVRSGGTSGGARTTGGSQIVCSVSVRPYIDDIEHGSQVFLQPGRFVLRPLASDIVATPATQGWTLASRAPNLTAGQLSIEYEVVDSRRNEVVVHSRATLACSASESNSLASHQPSPLMSPAVVSPLATITPSSPESAHHHEHAEVAMTPAIRRAAARILVLQSSRTDRITEVVGTLDVHADGESESQALDELRAEAMMMGADAVLGAEFHHGEGHEPTHLSGLAVRFINAVGPNGVR